MSADPWDHPWRYAVDSEGVTFPSWCSLLLSSDSDGLGLCGCGHQDRLRDALADFLACCGPPFGRPSPDRLRDPLAFELVAHLCARMGWTDHGSTVRGSWLTDKGRRALAVLRCPEARDP